MDRCRCDKIKRSVPSIKSAHNIMSRGIHPFYCFRFDEIRSIRSVRSCGRIDTIRGKGWE